METNSIIPELWKIYQGIFDPRVPAPSFITSTYAADDYAKSVLLVLRAQYDQDPCFRGNGLQAFYAMLEAINKRPLCPTKRDLFQFSNDGYTFRLLETTGELIQEGREMRHSVGAYSFAVARHNRSIVAVTTPDSSRFTIEVSFDEDEVRIIQFTGPMNRTPGVLDSSDIFSRIQFRPNKTANFTHVYPFTESEYYFLEGEYYFALGD